MNPQTEPVRLGALIIGVIGAVITLLVAFGIDLSADQQTAILGAAGALIALLSAIGVGEWVRRRVRPIAAPRDAEGRPLEPRQ